MAGKECYPGKTFETLSLNELKTVLENGLPKKLQNLRVKNINEVVREMLAFLKRNEVEIRGY
ncbi:MAG TPA: hypothetical protein DEB10_07295 [Ruminococcaceae bacterium]|nr:hypothetical protein [Oscillospiraceae bacterium]